MTGVHAHERFSRCTAQVRGFEFRDEALQGQAETAALKPALEIGADIENIVGTGNLQGIDGTELTVSVSSVIELGNKRDARMASIGARRGQLDAERQVEALDLLGEVCGEAAREWPP